MKVKILVNYYLNEQENAINKFIANKAIKIIDIKFAVNKDYTFAMIIYEENEVNNG